MSVLNQLKSIKSLGTAVSGGQEVKLPPADTKFDRIVNNVSRLPRLFLLFGVCGILIWPIFNPVHFMEWTAAIKTIPADLWYLIFIVMTSWVGTKFVRDIKQPSSKNNGPVKPEAEVVVQISQGRFDNLEEDDDDDVIAALDIDNEAIDKWKAKNAV